MNKIAVCGKGGSGKSVLVRLLAEGLRRRGRRVLVIDSDESNTGLFRLLGFERAPESLIDLLGGKKQLEARLEEAIRAGTPEMQVDLVAKYVDIIQIGTRNMYDQDLVTKVARKNKPVLFKRHFGAGIEEFLSFAEYAAAEGNKDIVLCERGILPLGKGKNYTRYTMDLGAIPAIQKETYLPIVADPSHATGRRDLIFSMSCAAMAAGASGLMIETHFNPAEALVDGQQTITPDELADVIATCRRIRKLVVSKKGN